MKLNFKLKHSLYALALLAGMTACTSEIEFSNNEDNTEQTSQNGIRFVIQGPLPDAIVSRADVTVEGDPLENEVKSLSLYIFAKNEGAEDDSDANYTLLKENTGIEFLDASQEVVPGVSGINNGDGSLSYMEPITKTMIDRQVKIVLVANDEITDAVESTEETPGTTLEAFKKMTATAQVQNEGSADVVSGNIYAADNTDYTGLVMTTVAYTGMTEGQNETVTLTPAGVNMNANLQRIMARIDLEHAIPNMILNGVKVLNASSQGHLFAQDPLPTPGNLTVNPTSGYTDLLANGISYDATTPANNTLKHAFYLYEQSNTADQCVTVEISYTLKFNNLPDKQGTIQIPFQTADGTPVNTVRNTLYTIKMGNGDPATDLNTVTTLIVEDWNDEEPEIEDSFQPDQDIHDEVITDLTLAEVGYYYLSDGTLRRSDYQFMDIEKEKVIGVVFHKYAGDGDIRFGAAEKTALEAKGVTPHGLIMSLKNAATDATWGSATNVGGLTDVANFRQVYMEVSGLEDYNVVKALGGTFPNHLAFAAIQNFDVETPENTTGWFLPSCGQWWDIVANLGGMRTDMEAQANNTTTGNWNWFYASTASGENASAIDEEASFVQKNINSYLAPLGDKADLFDENGNTWYWTSSEVDATNARGVYFATTHLGMNGSRKSSPGCVRPILAF